MRLLESSSCVFPVEDLLVVIIINIAQKLIPQIIHRSLYDLLLAIEIPVIGSPCNVCLTYDIRNRDFRESFLPKQRKSPSAIRFFTRFTYYAGAFTRQPDYLQYAQELVEAGTLRVYIDSVYSASETAEAIRYLLSSHASGKVVVATDFQTS